MFLADTCQLKVTNSGWCAGSTLCFYLSLWEKKGFLPLNRAVVWYFLNAHQPSRLSLDLPNLHVVVRHGQHDTWKRIGNQAVEDFMRSQLDALQSPQEVFGPEDAPFYLSLAQTLACQANWTVEREQ